MLLVIDNFDSFTYNLVQYLEQLGANIAVYRNDKITPRKAQALNPEKILISPGPCTPATAGVSLDIINAFSGKVPILGVCLGHQSIAQHFGGKIVRSIPPTHGKTSRIYHNGTDLFRDIKSPFKATRYHSLSVENTSLPSCLEITAKTETGEIMGIKHKQLPLWGVQFHPESHATDNGFSLLKNFLQLS